MPNKTSAKSPDAAEVRSLIDLCRAVNEHEDQKFLQLVHDAADTICHRADVLEIKLPSVLKMARNDGTMALVRLSLTLAHLRLGIASSYPDLPRAETEILSMETTLIGRAKRFDFRSAIEMGSVNWSKITMTVEELQKHIGESIITKRKSLGLTQQDLAAAIDMSQASVGRIEAGTQRLGVSVFYLIALALQVSPAELLPAELFPTPKIPMSLEALRLFRKNLPTFDREVLQRWEDELVELENRRTKKD